MGGFGSGMNARRSRWRTTDDVFRVDIRAWHRAGLLQPGRIFMLSLGDRRALATTEWKRVTITGDIEETVRIADTRCQFGGARPWALFAAVDARQYCSRTAVVGLPALR